MTEKAPPATAGLFAVAMPALVDAVATLAGWTGF